MFDPEGFKFSDLKELYNRQPGRITEDFLPENLEAIIFNGRRMRPLYKFKNILKRLSNPNITDKKKKRHLYILLGSVFLAAVGTHMELHPIGGCLREGDCYELIYVFDLAASYISSSAGYMLFYESSIPVGVTAVTIVTIYRASNLMNSWKSTKNSPRFDPINFNSEIGKEIRIKFAKKAGAYPSDHEQLESSEFHDSW